MRTAEAPLIEVILMAHRRKLGDIYAIPLPDGTFAFCRVLQSAGAAFYKHRGKNAEDIPLTEEYMFTTMHFVSGYSLSIAPLKMRKKPGHLLHAG